MTLPDPSAAPEPPEPANLRFLRRLVTLLTAVMLCGVLVVIGLLVTRLTRDTPLLPEDIALPDGATVQAVTHAADWIAIVTTDNRILIYDRMTGTLRQEMQID